MIADERVPGVFFNVKSSKTIGRTASKYETEIVLTASYEDQELYDKVLLKMEDGIRICSGSNIYEEALSLLKDDVLKGKDGLAELERKYLMERNQLELEVNRLRNENLALSVELEKLRKFSEHPGRWFDAGGSGRIGP